jgi:hypothetical protein
MPAAVTGDPVSALSRCSAGGAAKPKCSEASRDGSGARRYQPRHGSKLGRHFSGWVAGEIEAGAAPMMAVLVDGHAVSVCFCARRSIGAAEAGLETAPAFRGLAVRVTTPRAGAVRASGRRPLYRTSRANASSLAVVRKLGLRVYATNWSIER